MNIFMWNTIRAITSAVVAWLIIGASLSAQTLISITISWDPNPVTDNVISYRLTLDGAAQTVPFCETVCSWPMRVAPGAHTVSVAATNASGTGPATTVSFRFNSAPTPTLPRNLKVTQDP